MSTNTAITTKDNLKKAIKAGQAGCGSVAANIEKIINEALWDDLDLPGDNSSDKLHALITLPYDQGGLNTKIEQVDALLGLNVTVQRKFRNLVYEAKQGQRNDLKEDKQVNAKVSPAKKKKKPGLSSSQKSKERAVERATQAIPELNTLLEEQLVPKDTAAKLGQVVKDPENPTEKEQQVIEQREQVKQELANIVPEPLPEDPQERKEVARNVKEVIEKATGKVSRPKISLNEDPQLAAKAIAKANNDVDYLEQLMVAIELEIEVLKGLKPASIKSMENLIQAA